MILTLDIFFPFDDAFERFLRFFVARQAHFRPEKLLPPETSMIRLRISTQQPVVLGMGFSLILFLFFFFHIVRMKSHSFHLTADLYFVYSFAYLSG